MSTLAVYTITHNCRRIAYPFEACVASALALADRVWWCDAESDDGTWEVAEAWAAREPRLRVMRHPWGDHHTILPRICNGVLEDILSACDWAMQLQADEVACEWSFAAFREALDGLPRDVMLARPHYRHFCPDKDTTWPFIYDRKAVASRTASGARWDCSPGGDACALVGFPQADAPLDVHHYGKVQTGRERAALWKEATMQAMYADLGFPDPKLVRELAAGRIDYRRLFAGATFTPYAGPHPVFAADWLAGREGTPGG